MVNFSLDAQKGYSSASYSMGKMRAANGRIPSPSEIRVEEYVNYHEHQLPEPEEGRAVEMELRWGNERIALSDQASILQIGLSTDDVEDLRELPPVNLALVIDRSGSMRGHRISQARKAALALAKRLRDKDRVSIIAFNERVHRILPSCPARDKGRIDSAIRSIRAGGSTNLNAGMIEGYQQVAVHDEAAANSKLIVLTDALTNTGVLDPRKIVRNARAYDRDRRIGISMIGVGVNFNDALARQLTDDARTSAHFIDDAADIEKVFIEELESLLAPKARDVELEISYGNGLTLQRIYGYERRKQRRGNTVTLELKRMNSGLTQVIMGKFRHRPHFVETSWRRRKKGRFIPCIPSRDEKSYKVRARLSYYDIQRERRVTLEKEKPLTLDRDARRRPDKLADPRVKKNYTIAYLAQGLKRMARVAARGERERAIGIAEKRLQTVKRNYPSGSSDPDLDRMLGILEKYVPRDGEGRFTMGY